MWLGALYLVLKVIIYKLKLAHFRNVWVVLPDSFIAFLHEMHNAIFA